MTTIIRGYGGNAFRLVWESGMFSMEEHIDLASNKIDEVDQVIDVIVGGCFAVGQDVELQAVLPEITCAALTVLYFMIVGRRGHLVGINEADKSTSI